MRKAILGTGVVALVALAGCGQSTGEQALLGAGGGAGASVLLSGNVVAGALVGAAGNVLYCDRFPSRCN
ncbi:hypothetical protein [Sediminimonas sp.]|uniref:hypothetical protein n=1 Tax=Sediminimonas sp. TaxID=2823379 RepID=UPI0025D83346|nr:hypothetical protein [Sediminimonas sp.]